MGQRVGSMLHTDAMASALQVCSVKTGLMLGLYLDSILSAFQVVQETWVLALLPSLIPPRAWHALHMLLEPAGRIQAASAFQAQEAWLGSVLPGVPAQRVRHY